MNEEISQSQSEIKGNQLIMSFEYVTSFVDVPQNRLFIAYTWGMQSYKINLEFNKFKVCSSITSY